MELLVTVKVTFTWHLCLFSSQITTDFEPQERCLKCYSLTDSTAGEEFKIFYGQHSNADLFLNSGFVFMENKHDVVKIKLGLSSGEEPALLTMRKKLLQYFKLEP